MRLLRRFLALIVMSPLALLPTNVTADDPTIVRMVQCAFPMHHSISVPAGTPITLLVGWSMSTRGNLVDFVNAATATFTINGQAVTPTTSDIAATQGSDSGTGEDFWHVIWSIDTTAPAVGQTMLWTTEVTLSRPVTDHEGIEGGFQPVGQPGKIAAGELFGPPAYSCNITGV